MAKPAGSKGGIEGFTIWVGSVPSLIVHTFLFAGAFAVALFGFAAWDTVLLVVTTIVSLEAIYLAIFIQMSVNRAQESLAEVEEDIAGIEEDIDEISEDIEGIEKDVAEIEEDLGEVSDDIEELQEDLGEMAEEEDKDATRKKRQEVALGEISATLKKLIEEVEVLKQQDGADD